jgi:hypothetical protein
MFACAAQVHAGSKLSVGGSVRLLAGDGALPTARGMGCTTGDRQQAQTEAR